MPVITAMPLCKAHLALQATKVVICVSATVLWVTPHLSPKENIPHLVTVTLQGCTWPLLLLVPRNIKLLSKLNLLAFLCCNGVEVSFLLKMKL